MLKSLLALDTKDNRRYKQYRLSLTHNILVLEKSFSSEDDFYITVVSQ